MKSTKRVLLTLAALLTLPFLVLSCSDDSTSAIDEGPPPPSFSIASTTIQEGGLNWVLFWFTPSEDILLGRTEIRNPTGNTFLFSGGNQLFIGGEAYFLEEYLRVSGNWQFRFVGQSSPGGKAFDVRTTLSVGAKELN